ncbi:hypothetical protein BT69DRAFT_1337073 [Atractiella rhizophila]|nr:hypothetical protein BT69DRAFT_1337073 [Atractiella rhizophila]
MSSTDPTPSFPNTFGWRFVEKVAGGYIIEVGGEEFFLPDEMAWTALGSLLARTISIPS